MVIDFDHFTPVRALGGGALIGLSASWFYLTQARIAGISGLLGQVVAAFVAPSPLLRSQLSVTVLFLLGLALAPLPFLLQGVAVPVQIGDNTPLLLAAGFLVGIGTRYAGGCTSGHGVCGLSALSPRSLVATLLFMAAAFVTVAAQRWLA
jgi:uncharacterized membrane protein YedE/YeeE